MPPWKLGELSTRTSTPMKTSEWYAFDGRRKRQIFLAFLYSKLKTGWYDRKRENRIYSSRRSNVQNARYTKRALEMVIRF